MSSDQVHLAASAAIGGVSELCPASRSGSNSALSPCDHHYADSNREAEEDGETVRRSSPEDHERDVSPDRSPATILEPPELASDALSPAIDLLLADIRACDARRRWYMEARQQLRSQVYAACYRIAAYRTNPPQRPEKDVVRELERNLHARAARLRWLREREIAAAAGRRVRPLRARPELETHEIVRAYRLIGEPLFAAVETVTAEEHQLDRELCAMVKRLPVWPWVEGVRGADAKGLGAIVAQTGDLSHYASEARLWKRMGLAVMEDGSRQRRVKDKAQAEAHGFNPRRRAVMAMAARSLVMARSPRYYDRYRAYKARQREVHPDFSAGRIDNRACRWVAKMFLRDLWREWRRVPSTSSAPTAGAVG